MTAPSLRIRGARIVGRAGGPHDIEVVNGRIASIVASAASAAGRRRPDVELEIEADGLLAAPGFIDLQINGAAGHDLSADPTSIWAVGGALVRYGVTGFLPTIVSSPREVVETARRTVLAGPPAGYVGPRALGLHVEGPFIAASRVGAHDPSQRRDPDPAYVEGWSPTAGVRIVTLAPELPGALALTRELVRRGIVVSIGHTAATAAEAQAGIDAGARFVTHLFNAMPGLDHRAPGPIGVAIADRRVTLGLIPDGLHVDPVLVEMVWRAAGAGRVVAVTDAIAALGRPPGRYPLGTVEVTVDSASARLADGRLAGSLLTLDRAVRNLRAFTGASVEEALGVVTSTPARLLGLEATQGSIAEGRAADVTLLTDDLEVVATIVGGHVAHRVGAA